MFKIRNWFGGVEQPPIIMGEGVSMSDVMAAADARPTPPPASATDRLQRNLERTVSESTARAEVLRQEIAARVDELADVLRAGDAASVALMALDDRVEEGPFPADGPTYLDPHPAFPFGRAGDFSPITDEDLSAACGLALEAEMTDGK